MQQCVRETCERTALRGGAGHCTEHAYAAGIIRRKVARAKAVALIDRRIAEGHNIYSLSLAAGLSLNALWKFRSSYSTDMRRSTYDAILGADSPARPKKLPAWPLERRVNSLRAAGKTVRGIAAGAGVSESVVSRISRGVGMVLWNVDRKLRDYYEDHEMDPVGVPRRDISVMGWPLPMDWVDIDDPQERRGPMLVRGSRVPMDDDLVAAAWWLSDMYGSTVSGARAAGVSQQTMHHVVRRTSARVSDEARHRILYTADRDGWFPGIDDQAVAA